MLVKLRSFTLAQVESEPFGDLDKPDMFFQFYPELYGGRSGSMVPFSLRLLVAQLPAYVEKHQIALTRLYLILSTIRKVNSEVKVISFNKKFIVIFSEFVFYCLQMLENLKRQLFEDGTPCELSPAAREESIKFWTARETRVLHSVVNTALSFKVVLIPFDSISILFYLHI